MHISLLESVHNRWQTVPAEPQSSVDHDSRPAQGQRLTPVWPCLSVYSWVSLDTYNVYYGRKEV
jgi:hypothetical protein